MTRRITSALALVVCVVTLAACGGNSSSDDKKLVWCAAPGEKVDAQFKREYPELHMSKAACDAFNDATTD